MSEELTFKAPPEIERAIEEMPAISPIFGKLMQMARDMDTDPIDLVNLILIDPVLSGKVIKLVNSAYYGLKEQVQSLAQAVVMLGINTVKNLAMHTAVLDKIMVNVKDSPLNPKAFWYHCLATAVASKIIAKQQEVPSHELEIHFLAGLLHDLGKVLYLKALPQKYYIALDTCEKKRIPLDMAEFECFGFNHNQVGAMLARKWKMDAALVDVIENHHKWNPMADPMLRRVMLANIVCKQSDFGKSGNPIPETFFEDLSKSLDLDPNSLQFIPEQLPQELDKTLQFLKISKESLLS